MATKQGKAVRVVAYAETFQDALRAAIGAAGKDPEDVVQLKVTERELYVCARNSDKHVALRVDVAVEDIDLGGLDGELVDLALADARTLAAFTMRSQDPDFPDMVGLTINEGNVVRTDESGLQMGIRMARVRRANRRFEQSSIGDVAHGLSEVIEHSEVELMPAHVTDAQLVVISRVARALGDTATIGSLMAGSNDKHCALIHGEFFDMVARIPQEVSGESAESDSSPETVVQPALHVVEATPMKNMA